MSATIPIIDSITARAVVLLERVRRGLSGPQRSVWLTGLEHLVEMQSWTDSLLLLRTVVLGSHTRISYSNSLTGDFYIDDATSEVIHSRLPIAAKGHAVDVVAVSARDLGFTDPPKQDEIYARALERGLDLAPEEMGPALRLAYRDQPPDEMLMVGMEPIVNIKISDFSRRYRIFALFNSGKVRGLRLVDGRPDTKFALDTKWAFVRRRY